MHIRHRIATSITFVASLLYLSSAFAQGDVLACTAADGAVTYTDGRCGDNEKMRTVQAAPPKPQRAMVDRTQWASRVAPRQVRTDVESVRAAYEALRQRDARGGDLQIAGH